MRYKEYKDLYDKLRCPQDVLDLSTSYDEKLLDTLYTQKINREVKKRFYVVKQDTSNMLKSWRGGESIINISKKYKFPPILITMLIFLQSGISKKEFWNYVYNPNLVNNKKIASDIREAIRSDIVYSPEASNRQKERGIWGESLLHKWLDSQSIKYITEKDLRATEFTTKTPDCLLEKPVLYNEHEIHWIESKASFGDNTELKLNSRKQLIPYTKLFGPGLVIYWVGCLDDLICPNGVYVSDISVINKKLCVPEY